jgi:hypothetical protein
MNLGLTEAVLSLLGLVPVVGAVRAILRGNMKLAAVYGLAGLLFGLFSYSVVAPMWAQFGSQVPIISVLYFSSVAIILVSGILGVMGLWRLVTVGQGRPAAVEFSQELC